MGVKRIVIPIILSTSLVVFSGCGSSPVKEQSLISIGGEQLEQLTSSAELLQLYQTSAALLSGKDNTVFAGDYARLNAIGRRLVAAKKTELSSQFEAARLASGEVPMALLNSVAGESAPVPASLWAPITAQIDTEISNTNAAMKVRVDQLEVGELDDNNKLLMMDDLYRLSGDKNWLEQRNAYVDGLIEEIRQARASGQLTAQLQPKIDLVLENRGENKALKQELVAVAAEIYQKEFLDALGKGDADKAFEIFVTMSKSKDFDSIKDSLAGTSQTMVDHFVSVANTLVEDPVSVAKSYRGFSQARIVSKTLGFPSKATEGEKRLIKQLYEQYEKYAEQDLHTVAMAYLMMVKEFSPLHKGLRQKISEVEEKVRGVAIKRLSTTAFDGGSQQGYGDIISSKITQHLFRHVPHDIRIVEREQYQAILRERNLSEGGAALSSVDIMVTGSILEAKVDTTKQEGKKTIRAVIGKETIPNQAYIKWLELPAKERKKIEKPNETTTVDKKDNIPVKVTNHRKVGIFSVSYRLVDAKTGRVLYPNSTTKEEEFKGTSREGVEMGDFILPFELADLPSDVKILDRLATEVAEDIGNGLVEKLKDQEQKYLQDAEVYQKDNSCLQVSDSLAKALIILEAKGMERDDIEKRYLSVTINCGR
ncbi:MAG: curli biogenesis system outer membrane secretion channel CsgG [Lentisphaeria bacterium]|jgi:curli biogenesis system outer membrane secretion channel CsgG